MSFDINVFIKKTNMLTRHEWQSKIELEGFPVNLYPQFDTLEMSGMLPCTLKGEEAGFEYYFDELEDTMFDPNSDEVLASRLQKRDICVGFSVSAGLNEASIHAAVMAAATLAKATDGVLWIDPDFIDTNDPVGWVKQDIL